MKKKINIAEFMSITRKMVDLPLNHAWQGHGFAIFLEFGQLTLDDGRNNPQGEFSLMLDCSWRIEKQRSILIGSLSGDPLIMRKLNSMLGNRVSEVELFGALPEIIVTLDSGLRVVSFATCETQPDWTLFLPDRSWIHCRNGYLRQEAAEPAAADGQAAAP